MTAIVAVVVAGLSSAHWPPGRTRSDFALFGAGAAAAGLQYMLFTWGGYGLVGETSAWDSTAFMAAAVLGAPLVLTLALGFRPLLGVSLTWLALGAVEMTTDYAPVGTETISPQTGAYMVVVAIVIVCVPAGGLRALVKLGLERGRGAGSPPVPPATLGAR